MKSHAEMSNFVSFEVAFICSVRQIYYISKERTSEALLEENESLKQENLIQAQQIAYLKRQLFGSKSEKLDADQLKLFEELGKPEASEALVQEEAKEKSETKKAKPRKQREEKLPDDLPVQREEIIPEEVQANPEQWRCIGEDESKQLEKEPGYFYLRKIVRKKYVRIDHPFQAPVQASAPARFIQGNFWGDYLLSEMLTNRYLYALPFYRQEQLYLQRYGIHLSRSTMSDVSESAARELTIINEEMKRQMLASAYIGCDETPVKYLQADETGSSKGYYWVYRSSNGEVVFDWQTGRKNAHFADFIGKDFSGVIQSDGYAVYHSYSKHSPLTKRASCLAHIRRKFKEAEKSRPTIVAWILKIMAQLYRIESTLRDNGADAETRARVRNNQSHPLIRLLEKAVTYLLTRSSILSTSNLGKALSYAVGQLPSMYTYLDHGEVEIDNNLVENAIRPVVVGRKNHLFIGSPKAGQKSAILYSILLSAKACGVPPQAYLRDLMKRLPAASSDEIAELTPANWAKRWHKNNAEKKAQDAAQLEKRVKLGRLRLIVCIAQSQPR